MVTDLVATVPPGTYIFTAYCELKNTSYNYGAEAQIIDNSSNIIVHTWPFSNYYLYGGWYFSKKITITTTTTYYLQWASSDPPSSDAYIQHANMMFVPTQ